MNTKKLFLTSVLLFCLFFGNAQADQNNVITLKFAGYNVETDKLIQKEFSKKDGFKSIYTCIPAGIVVLEIDKPITTKEKETVSFKVNSLKKSLNYEILEGMTLSQAEENCSAKRNTEN